MARARLYVDEDSMSHALVRALRARGVDVVTALEEGMIERTDIDHLDYATTHGRVLLTFNVADFVRLHEGRMAAGGHHTGIVLAPQQRYSVGEHMRRIIRLLAAKSAEEMADQVEYLSRWGTGLR